MGMFSENYSGNRCSDCTWADNAEVQVEKYKKALELIKENSLNPAHTMTKLGLEEVVECIRKITDDVI